MNEPPIIRRKHYYDVPTAVTFLIAGRGLSARC
jgi:hypothetical protein